MANKPILEIPLDKLQAFTNLFAKYQDSLKKQPSLYSAYKNAIEDAAKGVALTSTLTTSELREVKNLTKEYEKQRTVLEGLSRTMKDIGHTSKSIFETSLGFLKWTTLGVVGLGTAALYEMKKNADRVTSTRALALSTGATFGGTKAFRATFGQYFDTGSLFGTIAEQESNIGVYGAARLAQSRYRSGMSTEQVAIAELEEAGRQYQRNPYSYGIQTGGFQGLDIGTARTVAALMASGEWDKIKGEFTGAKARTDVTDETQQKWTDLNRQLEIAEEIIGTDFTKAMQNAATTTGTLADKFIDLADKALPAFGDAIDALTDRIEGKTPGSAGKPPVFSIPNVLDVHENTAHDPVTNWVRKHIFHMDPAGGGLTLDKLRRLENGTTGVANSAGAIGLYQIKPGTAAQYRIPDDLNTASGNEAAAAKLAAIYGQMYPGNLDEQLVAYNQGSGWADRFKAAGDDPSILPKEAQKYLNRAHTIFGDEPPSTAKTTTIVLQNKAGGSIPLVAGQVAVSP